MADDLPEGAEALCAPGGDIATTQGSDGSEGLFEPAPDLGDCPDVRVVDQRQDGIRIHHLDVHHPGIVLPHDDVQGGKAPT